MLKAQKVLVVDSEPYLKETFKLFLSSVEEQVLFCATFEEAKYLLIKGEIGLIISDFRPDILEYVKTNNIAAEIFFFTEKEKIPASFDERRCGIFERPHGILALLNETRSFCFGLVT